MSSGLNFNEWQDAIHSNDGEIFGAESYCLKDESLPESDLQYLQLELQVLGNQKIPKIICEARGIGNWQSPKVIVMDLALGGHLNGIKQNISLWNEHPSYKRIRPFSHSVASRAKLIKLLTSCSSKTLSDFYVTVARKPWSLNYELLAKELYTLSNPGHNSSPLRTLKIITLDNQVIPIILEQTKQWKIPMNISTLEYQPDWCGNAKRAWKKYRETFNDLCR